MEFEYEGKVYPFEYFIDYVSATFVSPLHETNKAIAMKKDSEL